MCFCAIRSKIFFLSVWSVFFYIRSLSNLFRYKNVKKVKIIETRELKMIIIFLQLINRHFWRQRLKPINLTIFQIILLFVVINSICFARVDPTFIAENMPIDIILEHWIWRKKSEKHVYIKNVLFVRTHFYGYEWSATHSNNIVF